MVAQVESSSRGLAEAASRIHNRMASFKSAYLIHGNDHGRIAERRSRLRSVAELESGEGGIEILEGERATVEQTVAALSAMSLSTGRRFVIVDGAERWKSSELDPLKAILEDMPPETTLALFAKEEGRNAIPDGLAMAVVAAGGAVSEEAGVKPWKLGEWAIGQAGELGIKLDPTAAKLLVAIVGDRQQRLRRELEKIALALEPGASVDSDAVAELAAGSSERKVWTFADAIVAGQGRRSVKVWLELEHQGERAGALIGLGARRLREAIAAAERLDAGERPSEVRSSLRMPPKAAEAFMREIQRTDVASLKESLVAFADLEVATRGGALPMSDSTAVARLLESVSE